MEPADFSGAEEEPAFCNDLSDAQVTIVGLGLMGGSLAAALKAQNACRRVVGVARRTSTLQMARSMRFIDHGTRDLQAGLAQADLVILATPVRDILGKLATIGDDCKPGCVILDIGSTKARICAAMERMPPHIEPIGGHPMCGKETSGITMAEPNLYRDRVFVLAPLERTAPRAQDLARQMLEVIGARPLLIAPQRHDRLVAAISHLPYLLSVTCVSGAEALAQDDELVWRLAAGGFRDTSRVAAGSIPMMMDILLTNRGPVLEAIHHARERLTALEASLRAEEIEALETQLVAARNRRKEVFP